MNELTVPAPAGLQAKVLRLLARPQGGIILFGELF